MSFISGLFQTVVKTVVGTAIPPLGVAVKVYDGYKTVKAITSNKKSTPTPTPSKGKSVVKPVSKLRMKSGRQPKQSKRSN